MSSSLTVDFCSEIYEVAAGQTFVIGREGDLSMDQDNRFLHRHFLRLSHFGGLWILSNVGSQLSATIADESGQMEAFLAPGASLPIAFECTIVSFTAGPTTYELAIHCPDSGFRPPIVEPPEQGEATFGLPPLTPDQRRLIVALAEPRLLGDGRAAVVIPTSAQAAQRLGWTITKFNRKLDNVCEKLARLRVRGLHGDSVSLAANRRTRLVEYSVATRLVTRADLLLLDCEIDESDAE